MASPQTEDGWLKYAHELDAALAVADFTKGARIVLREVFSQIFGPAKRKVVKLSASRIGESIGLDRRHVHRGITELTEGNVLRKRDDGLYVFNKDYESWLESGRGSVVGRLRFTPQEAEFCRSAPDRSMDYKREDEGDKQNASVIQPDDKLSSNRMTNGEACHPNGRQPVIQIDDKLSSKLMTTNSAPQTPIEDRTRDSRRGELPEKGEEEAREPFEASPENPVPQAAPRVVNRQADIEATAAKAERLFPMVELGRALREVSGEIGMAYLSRALDKAHAMDKRGRNLWLYVIATANGMAEDEANGTTGKGKPRDSPPPPKFHTVARDSMYHPDNQPKPKGSDE